MNFIRVGTRYLNLDMMTDAWLSSDGELTLSFPAFSADPDDSASIVRFNGAEAEAVKARLEFLCQASNS